MYIYSDLFLKNLLYWLQSKFYICFMSLDTPQVFRTKKLGSNDFFVRLKKKIKTLKEFNQINACGEGGRINVILKKDSPDFWQTHFN